jgi:precorrin-2 dehydrogenase/sirohydrochlorin ferrochelatase
VTGCGDSVRQMGTRSFGYPVFLDLTDAPVLLVGGGPVAARKAEGLAAAGAAVTVIAPDVVAELDAIAVRIERRAYAPGDLDAYRLVITATNDPAVNAQVSADATAAGIWVNSADDPDNCSFILPAVARRGRVTVAVSTGGASPALASRLRRDIAETLLTPAVEQAALELSRQRDEIHAAGASTEDVDWTERVEAALRGAPSAPPPG